MNRQSELQIIRASVKEYTEHTEKWQSCKRCAIGEYAHSKVFYRGDLPCDILMIGEGPGKTEDVVGEPFIGLSGKIVDRYVTAIKSVNLPGVALRIGITNMVACRPCDRPGGPNRQPSLEEMTNCKPQFERLLQFAKPTGVILMGKIAREYWQGRFSSPDRVLDIMHPAAVLRIGGVDSRTYINQKSMIERWVVENYGA